MLKILQIQGKNSQILLYLFIFPYTIFLNINEYILYQHCFKYFWLLPFIQFLNCYLRMNSNYSSFIFKRFFDGILKLMLFIYSLYLTNYSISKIFSENFLFFVSRKTKLEHNIQGILQFFTFYYTNRMLQERIFFLRISISWKLFKQFQTSTFIDMMLKSRSIIQIEKTFILSVCLLQKNKNIVNRVKIFGKIRFLLLDQCLGKRFDVSKRQLIDPNTVYLPLQMIRHNIQIHYFMGI
ncbi:hypothetical protein pb186bvf_007842 [Paramecium bursaria]